MEIALQNGPQPAPKVDRKGVKKVVRKVDKKVVPKVDKKVAPKVDKKVVPKAAKRQPERGQKFVSKMTEFCFKMCTQNWHRP